MAFNIGLSGIRAASVDLEVTGNNVANASTVGFKESRAEFADVYTTSILGTGSKPVGSGVEVDNVRQEFSQGNISGTENSLDMAIDGTGFFVLNDQGIETYTRAGYFGLDKDGFVVANNGSRLQGYEANGNGVVNGVLGDLQIVIGNQPPALTSRVSAILNLDASELVKQELGQQMTSQGLAIASPDAGIASNTSTIHATVNQPTTAGSRSSFTFDIADGDLMLNTASAVPGPAGAVPWDVGSPGGETLSIDPLEGAGATTITLNAIPAATSQVAFIGAMVAEVQNQLNSAFGNNEFFVTTSPASLNPVPATVQLVIERQGFDSTVGTGFTITANSAVVPAWTDIFGDFASGGVTYSAGIAGSNLFVGSSPLTADFRSVPGTSTTNRTSATPPLSMTDFIAGTHAVLASTTATGATAIGDFNTTPATDLITFELQVVDVTGTLNTLVINLNDATFADATGPALGVPARQAITQEDVRAEIAAQIAADPTMSLLVNVSAGHPMTFTGTTTDNGETITLVDQTPATSPFSLSALGYATTNRIDTGTADIDANNQFSLQVTDASGANNSLVFDIIIPSKSPASYATLDELAAAIQTEVDLRIGATGLAGRLDVSAVGGQLVFTNLDVGSDYSVSFGLSSGLLTPKDQIALDALGLNTALGQIINNQGQDTIDRSNSFRINLTVPAPDADNRSGTASITLDEEYRSVQQVAASINRQIAALDSESYIGVRAEAIEIIPNVVPPEYQLQFTAVEDGEASAITITDFIAAGVDVTSDEMYGLLQIDEDNNGLLTQGIEGVTNEYPAQTVTLTDPDGNEIEITTEEDAEANEIASIFNRQAGVTASASSELTIPLNGYNNPANNMTLTLNGQALTSTSIPDLIEEINLLTTTTLPGFAAETNTAGDLIIKNSIGRDIKVEINSPTVTDSIVITGSANAGPVVLGGTATADTAAIVGGTIEFILNEGYTLSSPSPSVSGVLGALDESEFSDYVINSFDPEDQNTYNHATSTTIYDSLGNSHIMTQFFVKEPLDPTRPNEENLWAMYVQVDGNDVGDPDPTLPFPENLVPTRARYELFFNPDGTLDSSATGELFITNWDPVDEEGAPTGGLKSLNVLEGGLPLSSPSTNSNFQIALDGSTQFGSPFSVSEVGQNGYSTGRLTGLEIDADGLMFARFTNGQAQVLGQVALASFKNPEGLVALGDTAWGESFESGVPTVGSPRTGTFGNLRSSALEDSNVNLSEELVGLIIAQRNFQASAKTIETSDTVTQTIIQL